MCGGEDREGGGLKGVGEELVVFGEVDENEVGGGGDARHRQDNRSGIKADGRKIYALQLME